MEKAQNSAYSVITMNQLIKLKLEAIRAGVWFKALPKIDRVLVDLTINVAEKIRSTDLAKSIFAVVSKLDGLLESRFLLFVRTTGRSLAEKNSLIAQKWGNFSAISWSTDRSFALYLAVMQASK